MQSVIYQLTLVMGLGTLVILLIRGVSLQEALIRSGLVLGAVLIVLIIAANVLRFSLRQSEQDDLSSEIPSEALTEQDSEAQTEIDSEALIGQESEDSETG